MFEMISSNPANHKGAKDAKVRKGMQKQEQEVAWRTLYSCSCNEFDVRVLLTTIISLLSFAFPLRLRAFAVGKETDANKTLVAEAGCGTTIRAVIRRARSRLELRMAAALQETLSPRIPRSAVPKYRADAVPAGGFFISRSIVVR